MSCCTRYIDDRWNPLVDKASFQETAKQFYPPESGLALGDPEHNGHSGNYLHMAIWFDSRSQQRHSKLYHKKLELVAKGLKLNKFAGPSCPQDANMEASLANCIVTILHALAKKTSSPLLACYTRPTPRKGTAR